VAADKGNVARVTMPAIAVEAQKPHGRDQTTTPLPLKSATGRVPHRRVSTDGAVSRLEIRDQTGKSWM
jgi:hypothetical protein